MIGKFPPSLLLGPYNPWAPFPNFPIKEKPQKKAIINITNLLSYL